MNPNATATAPRQTRPDRARSLDLEAVKAKQRAVWSSGEYSVLGTTLQIVGEMLCEAVDLRSGERVLDVACGNGNAALAAARRFAEVTGVRPGSGAGGERTLARLQARRPDRSRQLDPSGLRRRSVQGRRLPRATAVRSAGAVPLGHRGAPGGFARCRGARDPLPAAPFHISLSIGIALARGLSNLVRPLSPRLRDSRSCWAGCTGGRADSASGTVQRLPRPDDGGAGRLPGDGRRRLKRALKKGMRSHGRETGHSHCGRRAR